MASRSWSHHPTCSKWYWSPHVSSSANDPIFYGCPPVLLSSFTFSQADVYYCYGRQNRRSPFCSRRRENLLKIETFGMPLFADIHHHVHAVASPGKYRIGRHFSRMRISVYRLRCQDRSEKITRTPSSKSIRSASLSSRCDNHHKIFQSSGMVHLRVPNHDVPSLYQ